MVSIRQHHPVLLERLKRFFETGDAEALCSVLQNLSSSDFRCSGVLLSDVLLPAYPQLFWNFFLEIVPVHTKAYLGTFLKAAVKLYREDRGNLCIPSLRRFSQEYANRIDAKKCLEYLLPELKTPEEVSDLLDVFSQVAYSDVVPLLLKADTVPSYYCCFRILQHLDEDDRMLRNYCIYLMKRGGTLSFNMVVILQSYFGLSELPGTFSQRLESYQLSRMESYGNFLRFIKGISV